MPNVYESNGLPSGYHAPFEHRKCTELQYIFFKLLEEASTFSGKILNKN